MLCRTGVETTVTIQTIIVFLLQLIRQFGG
jgi:hypothetical protein